MHASDFPRRCSSRRAALAAVVAASLVWGAGAVTPAWGETYNWTGTGTGTVEVPFNGLFDEATELVWDTSGAGDPELSEPFTAADPVSSTDRVLTFRQPATGTAGATSYTATNNIAGLNVHRMTFDVPSANAITIAQPASTGTPSIVMVPDGTTQPSISFNGAGSGNVNIQTNITLNGGTTLTFTGNGGGVLFVQNSTGATSGAGGVTVATNNATPIPAGGGTTVAFGGNNTYTGDFTLTSGEVVPLASSTATVGPFGRGTVNLNGGVVRAPQGAGRSVGNAVRIGGDVTFGTTDSVHAVTFTGATTIVGATRTITAQGIAPIGAIFTAPIGDAGAGFGLVKNGDQGIRFQGNNTYTGPTTVNQGRLLIDGTTAGQGTYTVNRVNNVTGVLGGGGSIGLAPTAQVVVNSGGAINPGGAIGTTANRAVVGTAAPGGADTFTADFAPGGIFVSEINSATPDTGYDQLLINGNIDVTGGTYTPDIRYNAPVGSTYYVIVNDGVDPISGEFANAPEGGTVSPTFGGQTFELEVTYDANAEAASFSGGNDMAVRVVSVVPEPASLGILAMGLGLLARRRRVAR